MSGSSRSLVRAMDAVFDHDEEVGGEMDDLMHNINSYLEKHNTLAAIAQTGNNVSEELFRIYITYIKPQLNIRREYLFLDVVRKLLPVLNQEEVKLWLQTYMRPAFDSAGYDLMFVDKSRGFLKRITSDSMETQDASLNKRRTDICRYVIRCVINVYSDEDVSMINLTIPKEKDQVFLERSRFIKENCSDFLKEFGQANPKLYYDILNDAMKDPTYRLDIVSLVSSEISIYTTENNQILNTGLWDTLLEGLLLELNEGIVVSQLSILVMLIPQIQVGSFLNKLFTIYVRISCWDEVRKINFDSYVQLLKHKSVPLQLFPLEPANEYLHSKMDHLLLHLGTILYGLFPLHFSQFCQNPISTIKNDSNVSNIVTESIHLQEGPLLDKLQSQYRSFLVHPTFLNINNISLEGELQDPLSWISYKEDTVGPVEISLACFGLNPDIIINEGLINHQYAQGNHKLNSALNSRHVSRASSLGGPMYMSTKEGPASKVADNFQRKFSIVPTNLVIEPKHTHLLDNNSQSSSQNLNQSSSHLKFMDYKFGEMANNQAEDTAKDPLGNLFSTHERLFHKSNSFNNLANLVSGRRRSTSIAGDGTRNVDEQTPVIEEDEIISETNNSLEEKPKQFAKSSSSTSITFAPEKTGGNSLDYYHREILLLKNELEFSSYMKHLNKFCYIRLKLKMLKKDEDIPEIKVGGQDKGLNIDHLMNSYQELSLQLKQTNESHQIGVDELIKELSQIRQENKELKFKIEDLTNEYKIIDRSYEVNIKEVILEKDHELENLRNKLQELDSTIENMNKTKGEDVPKNATTREDSVSGIEEQLYNAKEMISALQDSNEKLRHELTNSGEKYDSMVKNYESKVEASKLDVRDNTNAYVKIYEKRIAQLSATVLKYESLLEDKNSKIIQLSSSRPIHIPNSAIDKSRSSSEALEYAEQDRASPANSFHVQTPSFTPTPNSHLSPQSPQVYSTPNVHPNAQSHFPFPNYLAGSRPTNTVSNTTVVQQPTLKGRGGYQKRSKKLM